jgi:O-antigen/teichoic acid export membrane protein
VLLAEGHALTAQGLVNRRARKAAHTEASTGVEPDPAAQPVADIDALQPSTIEQRRERRTLAADLLSALTALALLAILQNFDVVLLGREAPGNAGSYAPISVACKPLVLAAFVLAGFLLPEAASRRHAGQHALRQLGVVLGVIAVPASLLIALSATAPTQVLRFAFGPRLTGAAPAFAMLAIAMTLLAATVLFTHYLLAAGRPLVLLVLVCGAGLTVGLLVGAHGTLVGTARADLIGQAVVALAAGLLVLHTARPHLHRRSVG